MSGFLGGKSRRTRETIRNGKRVKVDIDTDEIVEVLSNAASSYHSSHHDSSSSHSHSHSSHDSSSSCSSDSGSSGGGCD